MNYKKIYDSIISRAIVRNEVFEYSEKHHIVPKSLGGTDDESNIIALTAREHFIAHACLYKCSTGIDKFKMACAWNYMCSSTSKHIRYTNSHLFAISKNAYLTEKRKKTIASDVPMITLYQSGMTMSEVAKTLNKTVKTVHTALHRNNIKPRKAARKEKHVSYDILFELYITKWLSLNDIAVRLSLSIPTVKQQLKKHRIQLRTHAEQRTGPIYYITPTGTFASIKTAAMRNNTTRYCIKTYCHKNQHGYYLAKGVI